MADYYISTTGNNSTGSGTIGSPWATISKFLAKPPVAGDTLYLRGGTYTGYTQNMGLYIEGISGAAGNPITIRNYPGETVTIDGEMTPHVNDSNFFCVIRDNGSTGSRWWVFDGLRFDNMIPVGSGTFVMGANTDTSPISGDYVIRNCYIHNLVHFNNSHGHAFYIGFRANNIVVEDCEMFGPLADVADGVTGAGFHVFHDPNLGTNWTLRRCVVHGWEEGVQVWDNEQVTAGTIEHNTFFANTVDVDVREHGLLTFRSNVSDSSASYLPYDPINFAKTTKSHNYPNQTLNPDGSLKAGSLAINGAHDGTDAGAIQYDQAPFVIATTKALTMTRYAPTVTALASWVATPATRSVALHTFAPSVDASAQYNPSPLALHLATFQPDVYASQRPIPDPGALSLLVYVPTVRVAKRKGKPLPNKSIGITITSRSIGATA